MSYFESTSLFLSLLASETIVEEVVEQVPYLKSQEFTNNFIASLVLIVGLSTLKLFISRTTQKLKFSDSEKKRRWIVQLRNMHLILLILGLIVIWAFELKALALSAVAIGVMAFVVGTKELLVCLIGGFYQATAKPFKIGDRIEVNGFRGDVVDKSFISTTILEIGPKDIVHQYSGETVVLPNSVFLTHPVKNETFDDKYMFHVFSIPLKVNENWKDHEKILLEAANDECSQYIEDVRKRMDQMKSQQGIETPNVEPRVWVNCPNPDNLDLYLRIPTPSARKGRLEQAIMRKYLDKRFELIKQKDKKEDLN